MSRTVQKKSTCQTSCACALDWFGCPVSPFEFRACCWCCCWRYTFLDIWNPLCLCSASQSTATGIMKPHKISLNGKFQLVTSDYLSTMCLEAFLQRSWFLHSWWLRFFVQTREWVIYRIVLISAELTYRSRHMDPKSPSCFEGFEHSHLICFDVLPDTVGGSLGNCQKFPEFSVDQKPFTFMPSWSVSRAKLSTSDHSMTWWKPFCSLSQ